MKSIPHKNNAAQSSALHVESVPKSRGRVKYDDRIFARTFPSAKSIFWPVLCELHGRYPDASHRTISVANVDRISRWQTSMKPMFAAENNSILPMKNEFVRIHVFVRRNKQPEKHSMSKAHPRGRVRFDKPMKVGIEFGMFCASVEICTTENSFGGERIGLSDPGAGVWRRAEGWVCRVVKYGARKKKCMER